MELLDVEGGRRDLAFVYYKELGLPTVVVRLFNTIGPRQVGQYGMVVPRFISQALRGVDLTVYGDGEQSRSFTSVYDVVKALQLLMTTRVLRAKSSTWRATRRSTSATLLNL